MKKQSMLSLIKIGVKAGLCGIPWHLWLTIVAAMVCVAVHYNQLTTRWIVLFTIACTLTFGLMFQIGLLAALDAKDKSESNS
jgi:prepilin signal peptidase PulO-like enzyme (type II secretory pathway)